MLKLFNEMRNTKQGSTGPKGNDNPTLQQLMETINALQETVAASKADQDRLMVEVRAEQVLRQNQFIVELDALASNEELCKANEELRRDLQRLGERYMGERSPTTQERTRPMPFSQAIMDVVMPTNFIMPKIVFTGIEDPKAHLTAFNAQMMISGGTDDMHCKLFMGTFTSTVL